MKNQKNKKKTPIKKKKTTWNEKKELKTSNYSHFCTKSIYLTCETSF